MGLITISQGYNSWVRQIPSFDPNHLGVSLRKNRILDYLFYPFPHLSVWCDTGHDNYICVQVSGTRFCESGLQSLYS